MAVWRTCMCRRCVRVCACALVRVCACRFATWVFCVRARALAKRVARVQIIFVALPLRPSFPQSRVYCVPPQTRTYTWRTLHGGRTLNVMLVCRSIGFIQAHILKKTHKQVPLPFPRAGAHGTWDTGALFIGFYFFLGNAKLLFSTP